MRTNSPKFLLTNLIRQNVPLELIRFHVEQYSINLTACDDNGRTPFFTAALLGKRDIVDYLLSKHKIEDYIKAYPDSPRGGDDLFTYATNHGWVDIMKELVHLKWFPNKVNHNISYLLVLAVTKGHLNCVEYLVCIGTDTKNKDYGPALKKAILLGHANIVKFLLDQNVKLPKDEFDNSPLHLIMANLDESCFEEEKSEKGEEKECRRTLKKRYRETISLLLKYGFNINAQNADGNTPLHLAAGSVVCNDDTQLIEFLLEQKASLLFLNKAGRFPYDIAKLKKNERIVKYFEEQCDGTRFRKDTEIIRRRNINTKLCVVVTKSAELAHCLDHSAALKSRLSSIPVAKGSLFAPPAIKTSRKISGAISSVIETKDNGIFILLPGKKHALGSGTYGDVKLAYHVNSGKLVAVKKYKEGWQSNIDVENEINVAKEMGTFVGMGTVGNKMYFFQQLIVGENLVQVEDNGGLDSEDLLLNLRRILSLSSHLHKLHKKCKKGFVDLHQRNIMLSADEICHLVDFGLCSSFDTMFDIVHAYFHSPEKNTQPLKPSYDIYILAMHINRFFEKIKEKNKATPEADRTFCLENLEPLVAQMLDEDPKKRPSLIQVIVKIQEIYDKLNKQHHKREIHFTDAQEMPSFLHLKDLLEGLIESHIPALRKIGNSEQRPEHDTESKTMDSERLDGPEPFAGIKFEYTVEPKENTPREQSLESKWSQGTSLFVPSSSGSTKITILLHFDGTITLEPLAGFTLVLDKEGKLQVVRSCETNPNIAADLFNSLRSLADQEPKQQSLPEEELNILFPLYEGMPKLIQAVRSRNFKSMILEEKANPNVKDQWGMTALHHGLMLEDSSFIRMLVPLGAQVDAVDNLSFTPLQAIAINKSYSPKTYLLAALNLLAMNADYNALRGGSTAFDMAMECGNYDIAFLIFVFSQGRAPIKAQPIHIARFEVILNQQESAHKISQICDASFFSAINRYLVDLSLKQAERNQAREVLCEKLLKLYSALNVFDKGFPSSLLENISPKEIQDIRLATELSTLKIEYPPALESTRVEPAPPENAIQQSLTSEPSVQGTDIRLRMS